MSFAKQSQAKTPLLDGLRGVLTKSCSFTHPDISREFPSSWLIVSAQLCFERSAGIGGVDNLFAPQGVIQEAQQLAAADAFGAEHTWFWSMGPPVGGAAILATCATGDKIILPRNVHSSCSRINPLGAIQFCQSRIRPRSRHRPQYTLDGVAAALEQHRRQGSK